MKKIVIHYSLIISMILFVVSCSRVKKNNTEDTTEVNLTSYLLLDSILPEFTPQLFAEEILDPDYRYTQYCSFSPDGNDFYFSVTDSAWITATMYRLPVSDIDNIEKMVITESDYQSGQMIEPKSKKLYFTSILFSDGAWHAELYSADRINGIWSNPQRLNSPLNSNLCEWHPSFSNNGTLYFASERNYDHDAADIYRSSPVNGYYINVEKLSSSINTDLNETDPLIAPDESFLIFAAKWSEESGELDLYISFNKGNNNWSNPKNMKELNTGALEFAPALSPDGKYLFFTRRAAFQTLEPSRIYWVDSKIIDQYKE